MNYFLVLFFMVLSFVASAQHTVEECQCKARRNYPLIRQYGLVEKSLGYNLKNAAKGYLPQGTLGVQATYQSDVTELELPFMKLEGIPKDQYQAKLELNQVIWDGGLIRGQKNSSLDQAAVDSARIASTLYTITERVNSLCFGLLMLDEQIKLVDLLDGELQRNYQTVKSYLSGGVATAADLDAVEVELLTNKQKRDGLEA
ncbi:MAG: TolC family protein, partial [Rikenellaceae bacterium]